MRDHPDDRSGQGWGAGVARPEVTTLLLAAISRLETWATFCLEAAETVPATVESAVGGRFAPFPGRVCAKANSSDA